MYFILPEIPISFSTLYATKTLIAVSVQYIFPAIEAATLQTLCFLFFPLLFICLSFILIFMFVIYFLHPGPCGVWTCFISEVGVNFSAS